MFWTRAILWKIIKVLEYLIGMVRYFPARKKNYFFVPYLTRPHTLRHTGCTRLGENNVNPKVMQYVMGCWMSGGDPFSTDRSGAKNIQMHRSQ